MLNQNHKNKLKSHKIVTPLRDSNKFQGKSGKGLDGLQCFGGAPISDFMGFICLNKSPLELVTLSVPLNSAFAFGSGEAVTLKHQQALRSFSKRSPSVPPPQLFPALKGKCLLSFFSYSEHSTICVTGLRPAGPAAELTHT